MKYNIVCSDCQLEINQKYKSQLVNILIEHELVEKDFEYLFVIGGDGSFLKYAKPYLDKDIRIILINSGHLGFYSYVKNMDEFKLQDIFNDNNYTTLDLLDILHDNKTYVAINDFAYYSNFTSQIDTYLNDVLLQTIHGNGVLVATPLGSTGRNKSLNGALLMPNSNALTIIEVEAINNRYYSSLGNPIVINNKEKIKLKTTNFGDSTLIIDGVPINIMEPSSLFEISYKASTAKVLIRIDLNNWTKKLHDAFK